MSLNALGSNLREIYDTVNDSKNVTAELVPNPFGTRVYNTSKGWGRLWRWFFKITDTLFGKSFKLRKLRQAMLKTQKIFREHLPSIRKNIKTYQTYLQKKSAGYPVEEKNFHKARRSITTWNHATVPFLEFVRNGGNEKLSKLFKTYYPSNSGKSPFLCDQEMGPLKELQKIINLEGYLHEPLPLPILEKLATGKIITDSDKKALALWIDKLHKLKAKIHIGPFHDAMAALVNHLATLQYPEPPSLASLELALVDHRLTLFRQKDPKHIKWRNTLQPGDHLTCNGKEILLGEPIGKKFFDKDNNLVFGIKDNPDKVVYIGINRAVLGLKEKISKENSGGIPNARFLEIDKEGRFALMERLQEPLERYPWKTNANWLHHEDRDIATPLANLVKWMVQNKVTPQNFSPKHLMFDTKGRLRYAKICIPGNFDYTVLEDFLFACANGNRTVFCSLMSDSYLHVHPYQKFYEKMLKHALEGNKKKAATVAALDKISDPKIVDRGEALHQEVLKLKESCCRKIYEKFRVSDTETLVKTVKEEIFGFYYHTHASGILWPTIEEEVIASVVRAMKLQSRASP
ncbi:MAG: hypothetical protein ACE5GN_06315 [Waddliaceae bacterium]